MIKIIALLTRKDDMTHRQFMTRWTEVHAPLARGLKHLRRYEQRRIISVLPPQRDVPIADIQIDGIDELWFRDEEEWRRFSDSAEAQVLAKDRLNFVGSVKGFVVEDHSVIADDGDKINNDSWSRGGANRGGTP